MCAWLSSWLVKSYRWAGGALRPGGSREVLPVGIYAPARRSKAAESLKNEPLPYRLQLKSWTMFTKATTF